VISLARDERGEEEGNLEAAVYVPPNVCLVRPGDDINGDVNSRTIPPDVSSIIISRQGEAKLRAEVVREISHREIDRPLSVD
jgi:hypothetical protein